MGEWDILTVLVALIGLPALYWMRTDASPVTWFSPHERARIKERLLGIFRQVRNGALHAYFWMYRFYIKWRIKNAEKHLSWFTALSVIKRLTGPGPTTDEIEAYVGKLLDRLQRINKIEKEYSSSPPGVEILREDVLTSMVSHQAVRLFARRGRTADASETTGVLTDAGSEGVAAGRDAAANSKPEQTTESARRGSLRDSLLLGSLERETEMIESYVDTARELSDVFRHLVHERPVLVKQFLDAFAERSRSQELPESLGLTIGIQRVLSYLLRGVPLTEQITAYDRLSEGDRTEIMDDEIRNFDTHISSVLQALARENTLTLRRYKTNLHRLAITPERHVGALLLDYVHCKSMYPY